jgi:hypothetical protein
MAPAPIALSTKLLSREPKPAVAIDEPELRAERMPFENLVAGGRATAGRATAVARASGE